MKFKIAAFAALAAVAAPAHAETLKMPLAGFWEKAENREYLEGMQFSFGGAVTGEKVTTVNSKQGANGFHKPAEVACERALLNALIRVRNYAEARGGTAVQGIKTGVGGFSDSTTEYICDKSHVKAMVSVSGYVVK